MLLQKVSDTLTNSLPAPSPAEAPVCPVDVKETERQKDKKNSECTDGFIANTSTPNLTVNTSQQDTSDYVSAADEDLAVADWEYQLPAPPSAFRDSSSPVFDRFELIAPATGTFRDSGAQDPKNNLERTEKREECRGQTTEGKVKREPLKEKYAKQSKPECYLKKEVIHELENKIGTAPRSVKDAECRRAANNPSTAKVAPVDNALSNFTITTYSRQKDLNIFAEVDEYSKAKGADEKLIKSFATLSRKRTSVEEENGDGKSKDVTIGTSQEKKKFDDAPSEKKLEPKIQAATLHRWQPGNEKSNVHRSKSYVSVFEKPVVQRKAHEGGNMKNEKNVEIDGDGGMKKATSVSNLHATGPKSNEKFSQWRDNILKRQENPTKEKQLQSLQVSIDY